MCTFSTIDVAAVLLMHRGAVLLARRGPNSSYPGIWEIPGGKIEAGESPEQAAVREIREELGISPDRLRAFVSLSVQARASSKTVVLWTFLGRSPHRDFTSTDHDQVVWIALSELESFVQLNLSRIAEPDIPVLKVLAQQGRSNPEYFSCFG